MRVRSLAAGVALLVGMGAGPAACGPGGERAVDPTSPRRPRPTVAPTAPAPTGGSVPAPTGDPVPVPADLAALTVDEPPAGFVADRIPEGLVGPFGAGALREVLGPEVAEAWIEAGFRRGYGRAWRRPVGGAGAVELHTVWVLEFAGSEGADRALAVPGAGPGARAVVEVAVPEPAGARARRWVADAFTGPVRVDEVAFTRGARLFVVQVSAPLPGAPDAAVRELAVRQARRAG